MLWLNHLRKRIRRESIARQETVAKCTVCRGLFTTLQPTRVPAAHLLHADGVLQEGRLLHLPVVEQRSRHNAVVQLVVVAGVALVAQLPAREPQHVIPPFYIGRI